MTTAKHKQTTRMIKATCPKCGYAVRTTRVWLEFGTPLCPSGDRMLTGKPEFDNTALMTFEYYADEIELP